MLIFPFRALISNYPLSFVSYFPMDFLSLLTYYFQLWGELFFFLMEQFLAWCPVIDFLKN